MIEFDIHKELEIGDKVMKRNGNLYRIHSLSPIKLISQYAELMFDVNKRPITKEDIIEVSEEEFKANYFVYDRY